MATSLQAAPPFLGTHRSASIDATNAAIAAGSMFYSPGSTIIRAEDGAVLTLRGTGLAASFQAPPSSADISQLIKDTSSDKTWGITAAPDPVTQSQVMTSGAPTLTVSAVGAATSIANPTTVSFPNAVFQMNSPAATSGFGRLQDGNTLAGPQMLSFMTDSADFEISMGNSNELVPVNIQVGGKLATVTPATRSGTGPWRLRVQFSSKLRRRIDVLGVGTQDNIGAANFAGVTLARTDSISAVANASKEFWLAIGDSMCSGVGGPADNGARSMLSSAMTALGVQNWIGHSVGGSGYVGQASGLAAKFFSPAPAFTKVLFLWGYNDSDSGTNYSVATIQAAALTAFDAVHAAVPNALIIAATSINRSGTDNASVAIANAVAARSSFVKLIPGHSYITGTGKVGSTAGDGNRDFVIGSDNIHPTPYGHTYLGSCIAQDIFALRAAA